MRDSGRRARVRAWTGDREERVQLLALSRREGDLEAARRLALAAALDEPYAREALGLGEIWSCAQLPGCVIDLGLRGEVSGSHDPTCPLPGAYDLERWFQDLRPYGAEAVVRGALGVARKALEWWDRLQGWGAEWQDDQLTLRRRHYLSWSDEERHLRPRRLLDAVEGYILDPCHARAEAAAELPPAAEDELPFRYLPALIGALVEEDPDGAPWWTVGACASFFPEERVVRRAVREALIPWALGEADPLRDVRHLAG